MIIHAILLVINDEEEQEGILQMMMEIHQFLFQTMMKADIQNDLEIERKLQAMLCLEFLVKTAMKKEVMLNLLTKKKRRDFQNL